MQKKKHQYTFYVTAWCWKGKDADLGLYQDGSEQIRGEAERDYGPR